MHRIDSAFQQTRSFPRLPRVGIARPYNVPASPDIVQMNAQSMVTEPILKRNLLVESPSSRMPNSGSLSALICSGVRRRGGILKPVFFQAALSIFENESFKMAIPNRNENRWAETLNMNKRRGTMGTKHCWRLNKINCSSNENARRTRTSSEM